MTDDDGCWEAPESVQTNLNPSTTTVFECNFDAKRQPYRKLSRLCCFCNRYKSKLSQHIKSLHLDVPEAADALKLPKQLRAY